MNAVRASSLTFRYGVTAVLRDVDLEIAHGERIGILGDNGAGKTTLLRLIAGLLRPADGTVEVLGGSPRVPATRRRIGYLGHTPFLYPKLTAAENVRFWGRLYGVSDLRRRGAELLDAVGMDPEDNRPAAAHSQGMRRRVGLACALVHAPDVLLCDEPFAGLDTAGARAVNELLGNAAHSLVVATHEAERARGCVERFLTVSGGKIHAGAGG